MGEWWLHSPRAPPEARDTKIVINDIRQARTALLRYVQQLHFSTELSALRGGQPLTHSRLYRLEPWLNDEGLLCVSGRATQVHGRNTSKGLVTLPNNHRVTKLTLVAHLHRARLFRPFLREAHEKDSEAVRLHLHLPDDTSCTSGGPPLEGHAPPDAPTHRQEPRA